MVELLWAEKCVSKFSEAGLVYFVFCSENGLTALEEKTKIVICNNFCYMHIGSSTKTCKQDNSSPKSCLKIDLVSGHFEKGLSLLDYPDSWLFLVVQANQNHRGSTVLQFSCPQIGPNYSIFKLVLFLIIAGFEVTVHHPHTYVVKCIQLVRGE